MRQVTKLIFLLFIITHISCTKETSETPLSQFSFLNSLNKIVSIQISNSCNEGVCKNLSLNYKFIYDDDKVIAISSDTTLDLNFITSKPLIRKGYGYENQEALGFYYYSYESKYLHEFYRFNYTNNEITSYIHICENAFASRTDFCSVIRSADELRIETDSSFLWGSDTDEKISRTIKFQSGLPVQIIDSSYYKPMGGSLITHEKQLKYDEFGNLRTLNYRKDVQGLNSESDNVFNLSSKYNNTNIENPLLYLIKGIGFPILFDVELICSQNIIDDISSDYNGKLIKQIDEVDVLNNNLYKIVYGYDEVFENNTEILIRTE
ncbi:hypothetical protein EO244_05775 [Ancylomarina salipaludis]|uniref:Uncharacterized protein n=1 Tax=Ancylomarina salipaludis TaxID=2501299 RepID=A0A4Q1JNS8_9BACT|nr:hypothetical protein [Ancylomarina salipaludis]RXQ95816.1 hypothetical protein EO244_05775 [Ancylomarina salipaludis]